MRLLFLFCLLLFFSACKKDLAVNKSSGSTETSVSEDQVYEQNRFSLENATVYEKSGSKTEVDEVLDILYYLELLEPEKYKNFKERNKNDSLNGNFQIIKNCKNTYSFYTPFLSTSFPHFYKNIISHIAKNEGLTLKNLLVSETSDSLSGARTAIISFVVGEKKYASKLIHDTSVASIDESFYKVINKVLADKGDSSRFYLSRKIMVYKTDSTIYYTTDKYDYCLIKLRQKAANTLHQYPNVIDLSYEEHRFPVSDKSLNQILEKLKEYNFFRKLSEEELNTLKKDISENTIYDVRDIFYYISPIRSCISPVVSGTSQPYKTTLLNLKKLSGGKFKPTEIVDNYKPNSITEISFNFNDKVFSISLQNGYDYIDVDGIVQLANAALNQEEIDGNFYLLNNLDTDFCYIFMNKKQVEIANELLNLK